jgi:hypothetical protein
LLKTFPFWADVNTLIFLLCGNLMSPVPAVAVQGKSVALPAMFNSVQSGTDFLARLEQEMNSGKAKVNKKFVDEQS